MKTAFLPLLLLFAALSAPAQTFNQKFDSKGHPKAKGAWVTVRYPQGWEAKEGERPNIVKKFSADYKGYFTTLAVQIKRADAPIESECNSMSVQGFTEVMAEGDNSIKFSRLKKLKHEFKPAFIFDMSQPMQRAGFELNVSNRVMAVCSKDKLIMLWCGNMRIDPKTNTLSSSLQELDVMEPVCFEFFNSLVLMDNY